MKITKRDNGTSLHTQGQWQHGGGCCVKRWETEDAHGEILPERHVACTWGEDDTGRKPDTYSREDEANAQLIAAAPDLLVALKAMCGAYGGSDGMTAEDCVEAHEKAQALVARVEG